MLFNSFHFLLFFPIATTFYFLLPARVRIYFLLASSYYFYMCWKPEYVVLILFSTAIDYFVGIKMESTTNKRKRKNFLVFSLLSNLGVLFGFKYFNFFNGSARAFFAHWNIAYDVPMFHVLLPVGISFYTFQTLSYSIDVYRGAAKAEKNFGTFALYVAFFPQLVAGPIERSTRLLPQFKQVHSFDYDRVVSGLRQMLRGFFKKLVIADRLAIYVDAVYDNHLSHSGLTLLVATVFFSFQIYCDFSGYSDIAIGAARTMGFDLMENFRRPYFSGSIKEFWRRWHVSLSTWFRDYVYVSLGGNRHSYSRWLINILIVFVLSGLWHGANWTFVIWGLLHGIYMIVAELTKTMRSGWVKMLRIDRVPRVRRCMDVLVTFCLVNLAWVFFRADSVGDAFRILRKATLLEGALFVGQPSTLVYGSLGICFLVWSEWAMETGSEKEPLMAHRSEWVRHSFYASLVLVILLIGVFDAGQFIYFQF